VNRDAVPGGRGDFDGSGRNGVVVEDVSSDRAVLFSNAGGGKLVRTVEFRAGGYSGGIVAADFDGDGTLDVAVPAVSRPTLDMTVNVLLNHGKGVFAEPLGFTDDSPAGDIDTADFNGDGHPDVVVGNSSWVSVLASRCK
jgi:hypothetical protein